MKPLLVALNRMHPLDLLAAHVEYCTRTELEAFAAGRKSRDALMDGLMEWASGSGLSRGQDNLAFIKWGLEISGRLREVHGEAS